MSEEDNSFYSSSEEAIARYEADKETEYEEFLEFKRQKMREAGININESGLGDNVHPLTLKSYRDLGLEYPDNVRLSSQRHLENMRRTHSEVKHKAIPSWEIIRKVSRLKVEATNEEFMVTDYSIYFHDMNGNLHKLDYQRGTHPEVRGSRKLDANGKRLVGEIESHITVFDTPWDSKKFAAMIADNTKAIKELKELKPKKEEYNLEFIIGYTGKKGLANDKVAYTIKNAKDMELGKFDELYQLGQRGLSTSEPSLKKLSQPISDDPRNSRYKLERGYLSPGQISYTQGSYQ